MHALLDCSRAMNDLLDCSRAMNDLLDWYVVIFL